MNILKVLEHQQMAGTELSAHSSAQALANRGHRVYLLHNLRKNFAVSYYLDQIACPEIFHATLKRSFDVKEEAKKILKFIDDKKIDVAHFHTDCSEEVTKRIRDKIPTLYTQHVPMCPNGSKYLWKHERACQSTPSIRRCIDGYLKDGCGTLGGGQPWSLRGFSLQLFHTYPRRRSMLSIYKRVIAVSQAHRRELALDFSLGDNVIYVPEPIIDNSLVVEHVQKSNGVVPVVFAAGRLVPFKGFHHLIEASARIKLPHRIVIAGEGPELDRLKLLSHKLGVSDRVTFLGHVEFGAMQTYYSECAFCVVPSILRETFCRVGIEAMRWSKPVVAYWQGGIEDWLQDGVNGIGVPPGDIVGLAAAMERLLSERELCRSQGVVGRETSLEWTFENHAVHLESTICSILN